MKLTPNPYEPCPDYECGYCYACVKGTAWSEGYRAALEDVARDLEEEGTVTDPQQVRAPRRFYAARYRKAAEDIA